MLNIIFLYRPLREVVEQYAIRGSQDSEQIQVPCPKARMSQKHGGI